VNLVFVGLDPWAVAGHLAGRTSNVTGHEWKRAWGTSQWIAGSSVCPQQSVQLAAGRAWNRVHLRLWEWSDARFDVAAIGSAHHEYGITLGVATSPLHVVSASDTGRVAVSMTLREAHLAVDDSAIRLNETQPLPYSSGSCDVVRRLPNG